MPKVDLPGERRSAEPAFFSAQIARAKRFYFDLSPSPDEPLTVVYGGREACAADYQISRQTFPFTCIEFVAGGQGTLEVGGVTHRLEGGCAFTYGPGVPHVIRTDSRRPMVKYFIGFAGRRVEGLLADCDLRPCTVVRTSAPDDITHLMEELIATAGRHSPRGPAICAVILEHLLLRAGETSVAPHVYESMSYVTFRRCRQYICDHHASVGDLAEVGRACAINVSYMCRLFQRYDRQSPHQYLTRLRMAVAADLLHDPGRLVKEVAAQMGYDDPFHFSRAFKQVYGVSPRHFLHRHHG